MNIEFTIYENKNISKELITLLSEKKLYEQSYVNSHFKYILNELLASKSNKENYSFITIELNNNIVGLSVLEWLDEPQKIQAILLQDQFRANSIPKIEINKSFNLAAKFQIYIIPEYRNKGIASATTKFVEKLYTQHKKLKLQEHEIPLLIAQGRAMELAKHNMIHTEAIQAKPPYTNLNQDIHSLTHKYMMDIYDDRKIEFLNESLKDFQITPINNNKIKSVNKLN